MSAELRAASGPAIWLSGERYGAPRIHAELRLGHGIRVGKKRVARLMRERGIFGAGRRGGPRTTTRDPARASAPDLVDRSFARAEPNRLWVCDIKYVQTGLGDLASPIHLG